jgi:hypothetical protein
MLEVANKEVAVVGGGPAGLMAAEVLANRGLRVVLFDAMNSVGRKFLLAGKGGLNLTHSEAKAQFLKRYGEHSTWVGCWLEDFDAEHLRDWAHAQGISTMIGSSGRVFPSDLKAAPLLRGWVRRLHQQGVQFRMGHRLRSLRRDAAHPEEVTLEFEHHALSTSWHGPAAVLAVGGASWPELGSDGQLLETLSALGVHTRPWTASNSGFYVTWSEHLKSRWAGAAVKPVALSVDRGQARQGEFIVSHDGIEGSLVYAFGPELRRQLEGRDGRLTLDLFPGQEHARLLAKLATASQQRSLSERLRRALSLDGVRLALMYECIANPSALTPSELVAQLKALPVKLTGIRPIAEAISSAGGVCRTALDERLMLNALPGVFCAGEMLDWDAPTGGYLLTACFASGRHAALGLFDWLHQSQRNNSSQATAAPSH